MATPEVLRESDPAVVARYLHLRTHLHDRLLPRVEQLIQERCDVTPTRRLSSTLVAVLRGGFLRPDEGELWPTVFLSAVDITLALCLQIAPERLTGLGTVVNGPRRLRHRAWEDWWGWEVALSGLHPQFFELPGPEQEATMVGWYGERVEWLLHSGLARRRT